jgi:hypothetical protein
VLPYFFVLLLKIHRGCHLEPIFPAALQPPKLRRQIPLYEMICREHENQTTRVTCETHAFNLNTVILGAVEP